MDVAEHSVSSHLSAFTNMISNGRARVSLLGRKVVFQMQLHGKEILFVMAIMFTALAALQNGTKTRKLGPPVRFFPVTSLVVDYAFGNMNSLSNKILEQEISFVMYYAPWDARSMQARDEFEEAAKFYHNQVFFASINCWWLDGECRALHKIKSFPVFVVYLVSGTMIEFKAPISAENMIAFLHQVMNPYVSVHSKQKLAELQSKYQSLFLAHFNFSLPKSPGFAGFVKASYDYLEVDPFHETCFGLVTNNKLAHELRILSSPRLFLWNATKKYPHTRIQSAVLTKWLESNVYSIVKWITVSGMKGTTLWKYMEHHPSLILFTPRNHLMRYSPYFTLLRYLMTLYSSCNMDADQLVHLNLMKKQLRNDYQKLSLIRNICSTANNPGVITNCHSFIDPRKLSRCSVCHPCEFGSNFTQCIRNSVQAMQQMRSDSCLKKFTPSSFYPLDIICGTQSDYDYDHSSIHDDKMREMLTTKDAMKCKMFKYFHFSKSIPNLYKFTSSSVERDIASLSCQTNKSFNVLAMDSFTYPDFSFKLGVNITAAKDKTAAIILSAKDEMQHILKEVTLKNLVAFLLNFTENNLERYQRTSQHSSCDKTGSNIVCVEEVNGKDFYSAVINNTKDVVLMYYTSWCGFCSGIAHIYLYAAEYFKSNKNITFLRINGDENDLPWQFSVSTYPSIILFPGDRKGNSIEFPKGLQITELNLIEFVLYHAQESVRRYSLIEKCSKKCMEKSYDSSIKKQFALNNEIKSLRQKIFRYKQRHSCNPTAKNCFSNSQVTGRLNYLNEQVKNKLSEMKVTRHIIDLIPSILRGKRDKLDLLDIEVH